MSARVPSIANIGIEDVISDGQQLGATPEQMAGAVQKWHGLAADYGDAKLGTSAPAKFFDAYSNQVAITQKTLDGLRQAGRDQWFASNFQTPESAQSFSDALKATDGDPQAMGENDPAYAGLMQDYRDKVLANPVYHASQVSDEMPLYSGSVEVGKFRARTTSKGDLDALIALPDGTAGRVQVPAVTEKTVQEERAKTQEAMKPLKAAQWAYDNDVNSEERDDHERMVNVGKELESHKMRLVALSDPPQAIQFLTAERITEVVKNSPLKDKVGTGLTAGFVEDMQRGLFTFVNDSRIGINDITGDKETRDQLREYAAQSEAAMPGASGARFRGGVGKFVSEAADLAGMAAPTLGLGLATGGLSTEASVAAQFAARLTPIAAMTPQLYGSAVNRTLSEADQLDQQSAAARQAGDAALADTLMAKAQDFREHHRSYAAATTAAFIAPQFLFHANELFRAGEGPMLGRVAKAAGAGAVEMGAVATLQGQVIDPAFGKERGEISDIAYQAAMGGLLAAPNPVLGALYKGADPFVRKVYNRFAGRAAGPASEGSGATTLPVTPTDPGSSPGPAPVKENTLPETPESLDAQRQRVAEGSKPAMLFPDKSPQEVAATVNLAPDETLTETLEGTVLHKPETIHPEAVLTASAEGRIGEVLGYGVPAKPAEGTDTAIVHRDADGNELAGVAATPETAEQITATLEAQAKEGDTVAPEHIQDTLKQRLSVTDDANTVSDPITDAFNSAVEAVSPREYKLDATRRFPTKAEVAEARRRQALPPAADDVQPIQFSKAKEFIDMATAKTRIAVGDFLGRVALGSVTERAAKMIQRVTGQPAEGTRVDLRLEAWRHADKKHGVGSSEAVEMSKHRDQIPLRAEDIDNVAPTVLDPDALGIVLNANQARRVGADPNFIPGKDQFSLIAVKQVGDQFIVASTVPNTEGVAHVRSVYKRKVRQGATAEDVLQEILQGNASRSDHALTQEQITTLLQKRQAQDTANPRQASIGSAQSVPLKAATEAAARLRSTMPELASKNVTFADSGASHLTDPASRDYTAAEQATMHGTEGFHDPATGRTVIFLDQISQRPGETPKGAVARVLLHERAGHEGVNFLLRTDSEFKAKWERLFSKIPGAELADLISNGYDHLPPHELALEWLARKVDGTAASQGGFKVDGLRGVARQMWDAIKGWTAKALSKFSARMQSATDLRELIHRARQAALSGRSATENGPTPAAIQRSFASLKRNLGDLADGTKKVWDGLKDVPKFTPFRRAINGWVGAMQRSALSVRHLQEGIERAVKDPLRREAITNYLHAGGDMVKLAEWEAKSTGRLAEGYKIAQNLTPEEVALAGKIRGFYDQSGALGQKEGVLAGWQNDYVNKVWKDRFWSAKLTRDFVFGKQAANANFFEGEQKGLVPATKDISKLAGLYIHELHKTIATRQMIKDLTTKTASDGRPLAAPLGGVMLGKDADVAATRSNLLVLPHAKGKVRFGPNGADGKPTMVEISDYKRLNNPALSKWRFLDTDEAGKTTMMLGELALHPEIHAHLKNALGASVIKEWIKQPANTRLGAVARKIIGTADHMNSFIKQTMLSISPFHIIQEGTHAIGHKVNPFSNIPKIDPANPQHIDAMQHGLMLGGDEVAMQNFVEGNGSSPLMERIPGAGKLLKAISDFTFHTYIPGLKIKTYDHILERNTARFAPELAAGKLTSSDVKYLSATQTNNAYGHLNYKDIGRNPTFQHLARMALLAPDFLEARYRFTGDAALRGKVGREQQIAMLTLATTFYVAARVLNAALNDGDTKWKHPFSVVSGNREYAMRSVPEDIYKLIADSRKFIYGRLSPLIGHTVIETLTGKNYRGEKVSFTDTMKDTLLRAIPLSIRMAPGLRELTQSTKESPVSPLEQFTGSLGIQITRNSPIQEVQKLAGAFAEKNGKPNPGSYPLSPYRPLRFALEDLDMDKAQAALTELKATGRNLKAISDGFKTSLFRHWTGGRKTDEAFKASLEGDDKILLDLATQRRVDVWNRYQQLLGAIR